ncbi:MAG: AMP-binding protein, partial [Miltoncostaeaceae bacterium]
MSEWSDWCRHEDPTAWVFPSILRQRAEATPDRPFLSFDGGEWQSYGAVNARANRVANALIARGLAKGEAVSTLLPNSDDNLAAWFGILKAGGVQSPINLAYKGDFLSWVINLPRSRHLIIADSHLEQLAHIASDLPDLEHVVVWSTGDGPSGPPPNFPHEPFEALLDSPDHEPDVEVAWTDDARVM